MSKPYINLLVIINPHAVAVDSGTTAAKIPVLHNVIELDVVAKK